MAAAVAPSADSRTAEEEEDNRRVEGRPPVEEVAGMLRVAVVGMHRVAVVGMLRVAVAGTL